MEVQVPQKDVELLRQLAGRLRGAGAEAETARESLRTALGKPILTGLDVFASDLPDDYFEGIFDSGMRQDKSREADL